MTNDFYAGSAKIYKFPVRNHSNISTSGEKTKVSDHHPASNLASVRHAKMTFGSAWYHEEAIQNAKSGGKN